MNKKFLFFLCLIVFSSCEKNKNNNFKSKSILTIDFHEKYCLKIDSIKIPSDMVKLGVDGISTHFFYQDTSYLVFENRNKNAISICNLNTFYCKIIYLNEGYFKKNTFQERHYCFKSPDHLYLLFESGDLFEIRYNEAIPYGNVNRSHFLQSLGLFVDPYLVYINESKVLRDTFLMFPVEINPFLNKKVYSNSNYNYPITASFNLIYPMQSGSERKG